jgi:UDP-N-acetyl-alpha-D-quinovosamine dehydrogenase
MVRVLVTGGSGFVGSELCRSLAEQGFRVRAVVRDGNRTPMGCDDVSVVEGIDSATQWSRPLDGIEAVVHLAAKAHVTRGDSQIAEYVEVNANATKCLAYAAVRAGVRRFVYLSSIKVNGLSTTDRPFRADDEVRPDGPYGYSKWLGERHLVEASAGTGMEAVIVRPPLVYGPGVKANFLALLRWVDRGWPLPLASVQNLRSLVSIWNLTDFIATLLRHSQSAAGTWLVSDGNDLSTPALIELIGSAMKRRVRLLAIPTSILRAVGAAMGVRSAVERLCGSLAVDMSATSGAFGWKPVISVEEGIDRTVSAYLRGEYF